MSTDGTAATPAHPAVAALTSAITHRTIAGPDKDDAAFEALHADLRARFPEVFAAAEVTDLGDHALLLRLPGDDPDAAPAVLLAHQDVVPAGDPAAWTHPPYDGTLADGYVWGRGSLDDKGALVAILAAAQAHLAAGRRSRRDVWLSFGSDEEIMGVTGPRAAAHLRDLGVAPWFVLDEGGAVVDDAVPGMRRRCAMIGLSEKGEAQVELRAAGGGGHASQPPRRGAAGRLARALLRIERHPARPRLSEPVAKMIAALGEAAGGPLGSVATRAGRVGTPVAHLLAALGPELAALTRSTVAITELTGAPANNVLPATATAGLNVRIAVGDDVSGVVTRLRRVIRDEGIEVRVRTASEPSPVSPTGDAWDLLAATLDRSHPGAAPVPYLVLAATDGRHFHRIWPAVYRFAPFAMSKAQRESVHNVDERIGVRDFLAGVAFYEELLGQL